jgi:hypothetical protein
MKDMQAHLEKLREQAAECETIRDLATDPAKRDTFGKLAQHFKILGDELEREIAKSAAADTFLGRKTQEAFPKEDDN